MIILTGKRGQKSIWECDVCKKHFEVSNSRATESIKKNNKKFCSKQCLKKYQKEQTSKRVVDWVKKNGSPAFKGGIGITNDGYVWVRVDGRFQNQVKLHRYLMEVKLGRRLKSNEIVHHINEDKFDNRIENLEILSISEHNRKHRHFCKEKRTDIWTEEELEIIKNFPAKEAKEKLQNRTVPAIHQKLHRLRNGRR